MSKKTPSLVLRRQQYSVGSSQQVADWRTFTNWTISCLVGSVWVNGHVKERTENAFEALVSGNSIHKVWLLEAQCSREAAQCKSRRLTTPASESSKLDSCSMILTMKLKVLAVYCTFDALETSSPWCNVRSGQQDGQFALLIKQEKWV